MWGRRVPWLVLPLALHGSCAFIEECDVLSEVLVYTSERSGRWLVEADDGTSSVRCEIEDLDAPMPPERCVTEDWLLSVRASNRRGSVLVVRSLSLPPTIHVRIVRDGVEVADRTVVMHHERSVVEPCPSAVEAIDLD